jgi:hypothetical protein
MKQWDIINLTQYVQISSRGFLGSCLTVTPSYQEQITNPVYCAPSEIWPGNQHCYKISSEYYTGLDQAEDYCRSLGAHLVSFHSREEEDFVV